MREPTLSVYCASRTFLSSFFFVSSFCLIGGGVLPALSCVYCIAHPQSSLLFSFSSFYHTCFYSSRPSIWDSWMEQSRKKAGCDMRCAHCIHFFSTANITFPRVEAIFTNKNTQSPSCQIKRNFILLWWVLRWMEYVMYQVGDDERANYSQFSTIYTAGQEDSLGRSCTFT